MPAGSPRGCFLTPAPSWDIQCAIVSVTEGALFAISCITQEHF